MLSKLWAAISAAWVRVFGPKRDDPKRAQPKPQDTVAVCWLWSEAEQAWQPELTVAAHMANTRTERDRRLSECDWVVTKAQETGQPVPKPWRDYRQALRDVSKQPGFPTAVVWPIKPE
jgi:hypothetical protein